MQGADQDRVEELFFRALSRPPPERPALLAELCRDDEPLRRLLEELLAAHARVDDLLPLVVFLQRQRDWYRKDEV